MAEQKENRFSGMTPEEIKLEAQRQIVRSAFLALAALIVIGVACYAWFVSSSTVTAIVGSVTPDADCFELASEGTAGKYDGLVPGSIRVLGEAWPEISVSGTQTTQNKKTILWNMTSDNKIGNIAADEDEGICPGTNGKLRFFVIPKRAGDLRLTFRVEIIPMQIVTGGANQELTEASPAWKPMQGHLLFSHPIYENGMLKTNSDGNPVMELVDMKTRTFTLDFGTIQNTDEPIPVTLEWNWPYLKADAERLLGDDAMTNGENAEYLYYAGTDTAFAPGTASDRTLEDYYNDADQIIGETIDYIVLRLTAEK